MVDPKYAHLPLVPEAVLKKRHDLDELVRKKKALQEVNNATGSKKRVLGSHFYVKKPESFIARAKSRSNAAIRFNRIKRKGMQKRASNKPVLITKPIIVDDDEVDVDTVTEVANGPVRQYQTNSVGANMVFVIRVRDHQGAPAPVRSTLNRLRLKNIHEGVFIQYNDQTRAMLHTIEPWIVYGRPSKQIIADLIERRGYARLRDGKERVPLSDNTIIEEHLGSEYNLICKEDLVHELDTVGPAFDIASNFLFPFKLIDSKTIFERQTLKLKDGKYYGDRGDEINEYIKQVL